MTKEQLEEANRLTTEIERLNKYIKDFNDTAHYDIGIKYTINGKFNQEPVIVTKSWMFALLKPEDVEMISELEGQLVEVVCQALEEAKNLKERRLRSL